MKHLLLTAIAAVVLVGCGESQQSAPAPEIQPAEPVAEAATPEPAPVTSIHKAVELGSLEDVKQHLADGVDVDAKDKLGWTPLLWAAGGGHKEIVELLIAKGANLNAKTSENLTPLNLADNNFQNEIAETLIANGASEFIY